MPTQNHAFDWREPAFLDVDWTAPQVREMLHAADELRLEQRTTTPPIPTRFRRAQTPSESPIDAEFINFAETHFFLRSSVPVQQGDVLIISNERTRHGSVPNQPENFRSRVVEVHADQRHPLDGPRNYIAKMQRV